MIDLGGCGVGAWVGWGTHERRRDNVVETIEIERGVEREAWMVVIPSGHRGLKSKEKVE